MHVYRSARRSVGMIENFTQESECACFEIPELRTNKISYLFALNDNNVKLNMCH